MFKRNTREPSEAFHMTTRKRAKIAAEPTQSSSAAGRAGDDQVVDCEYLSE
jgi:hypothetical protein